MKYQAHILIMELTPKCTWWHSHSLQISSGGSADVLWSSRSVVWRERPGRWQKLHLSRCGRVSHRLHRHLRRQSRQFPDPTSWLCEHDPVERSDLQWPLLPGTVCQELHLILCPPDCTPPHPLLVFRCTFRPREPPASVYPSAGMNTLMLLWCWGG